MTTNRIMKLEVVSHCWNYARLLTYQLSSLVLYPPKSIDVTMTVFFEKADRRTCEVLAYFGGISIDHVKWNFRNLEKPQLFRRAIGRNIAALETEADWVFYTDCDQAFRENCLDSFANLMSLPTDKPLVFPRYVYCSDDINPDNQILTSADQGPKVLDIDPSSFRPILHTRAIGGVQIARADVLHRIGYCKNVAKFMKPASKFGRTKEDVVFRKLMGTQGEPMDIPNLYRIEHKQKGRRWMSWRNKL